MEGTMGKAEKSLLRRVEHDSKFHRGGLMLDRYDTLIKAALAEAREAGLQEGMQAFTAEAAESVEVARREAWHDLSAEEWNELYPVGVPVRYWPVLGDELYRDTITRGQAWTLGDGHSVVTIQGQPGGVSLRHLAVRVKGEEH